MCTMSVGLWISGSDMGATTDAALAPDAMAEAVRESAQRHHVRLRHPALDDDGRTLGGARRPRLVASNRAAASVQVRGIGGAAPSFRSRTLAVDRPHRGPIRSRCGVSLGA